MRSAQNIANPFAHFPIEVLIVMFSYLNPEQIALSASVNKQFHITSADNFLWEEKLKKHFPSIYNKIKRTNEINWYAKFCRAYEEEYRVYDKEKKVYIALPTNMKKLFSLVKEGDVTSLEGVLKLKDLDQTDVNGILLLDWATKNNHQALLNCFYKMVLKEYQLNEYTLDTSKTDEQKRTILHWAILCHQSTTTIKALIKKGADIHATTLNGFNSLRLSAKYGRAEIAQLLIEQYGADVNACSGSGTSALMFATENGHKEVVKLLLNHDANPSFSLRQDHDYHKQFNVEVGDTPLHVAIKLGHTEIVQSLLLAKGTDINVTTVNGFNSLRLAAKYGRAEIAQLLIEQYGADVNACSGSGTSALMFATENGHKEVVKLLLNHGANTSFSLQQLHNYHKKFHVELGDTPLHVAIKLGHTEIVQSLLLAEGTDINALTRDGFNSLRLAAKYGQAEIAELLISKYKVDVNACSGSGTSALMFATENGHKEVVDVLLNHGANTSFSLQQDHDYHKQFNVEVGDTPLHVASRLGSTAIVRSLLKKNANIEATNHQNQTPADVAIKGTRYANKLKLLDYLAKVKQRIKTEPRQGKHHKKSFTILGFTFDFGFSAEEKEAAAEALKGVIFDRADKSCLDVHQRALNNGDLKMIKQSLRV